MLRLLFYSKVFKLIDRCRSGSFIKIQTSGKSSKNEWYNEWQRVTTSGTTSCDKWYNKWQRETTSNNEWQRVVISVNIPFFRIREELNHSFSREPCKPWREPIELKAETSP